ncbi:sulfotransferase family 2 domain-containing protein [Paracoccus marinaquae]|uniref:Sulfotransferase family protein n=1 Tax=Paracoccus marinaquae TaxID=2841926 RepID=A0ABS6AFP6_9RHOB|nr:sulfotransferase family 2 domain-containing protein [Paracoccus marinaquae]MBU3029430.1 sulfotransferase family protein [Paracoccus marinaquae]
MPIFKHAGKLLYFAHVPKCAGTSIENYLIARFGPAAFLDRRFPPGNRHNWSRTSPQHIPAQDLAKLFPAGFLDAGCAFVRDPLARARSAFHFHQGKRGKIPEEAEFDTWLPRIAGFDKAAHARFDDHFRPQAAMVPDWCRVFRLEDGFAEFIRWLDDWSGASHPNAIGHALSGGYRTAPPSDSLAAFVREYYAEDYERFRLPIVPAPATPA